MVVMEREDEGQDYRLIADVLDGYVSLDQVRSVYGHLLSEDDLAGGA